MTALHSSTVPATDNSLSFKLASEDWEFEEIHRLNYQTFVEEIPQHSPNADQVLIDRFHNENTYFIALRGRKLIGMMVLRDRRPFSLDQKLPNLDQYLKPEWRPGEVRLLAATVDHRGGIVFRGLVDLLVRHAVERGFDVAVISGTPRQAKLYQHMGFVPFGPLVGTSDAPYQPMYLTFDAFRRNSKAFRSAGLRPVSSHRETVSFLPGPVAAHPDVQAAFAAQPISHRSPEFARDFHAVARSLCQITNANHVHMMMGSGTLANDAIAAEISRWGAPGLILSNGAFGERLIDHATRFGVRFETVRASWGQPFDWPTVESLLDRDATLRWLWAVHGETSTGVLNDLDRLKAIAAKRGLRLALDAVSSLGTTPLDLNNVALASGVSGKGLRAYPGLSFVFRDGNVGPSSPALPRYLDLRFYEEQGGIPFTVSSNLLYALKAAIKKFEGDVRFEKVARLATRLRAGLNKLGLQVVAKSDLFLAVTTIDLPKDRPSIELGQRMEEAGYLLHYRSEYLVERNWLQICLMGEHQHNHIEDLLSALRDVRTQ